MITLTKEMVQKDLDESPRFRRKWKKRWQREKTGPANCHVQWYYEALGVQVVHCGHPTALRPYYVVGVKVDPVPGYGGLSPTFTHVLDAQIAAFVSRVNELNLENSTSE